MTRINVVTGAASGIGLATKQLLERRGESVIGVDIRDADVLVDLTSPQDRERMVEEVGARSGGSIDTIVAVAGLAAPIPATAAVNYFGMVATLEGLRPLLAGSDSPRAVGVASFAGIAPGDEALIAAFRAADEPTALARATALAAEPLTTGTLIYPSSKAAFAQWVRRSSTTDIWAGSGIPLNAIAPGVVSTPMMDGALSSQEGRDAIASAVPMPLNGFADAQVPARLLAWLVSVENSHLCGQVIFVDGGSDASVRGDSVW
ncbi:SDR family oxidoreductase [Streptomyces sp. SID13031]|uniref:SDR family oxidoreductase n=1 Tax=Streptomyces sp. SID13031 TaxID=2706046 RepID=UPI0013C54386|nr:SDR family oxidoreductase [Streptomyces sp. SID13031]NEA36931.1 SDR family oxidoreductase [Streptomyces sp. SID13031]